MLPLELSPIKCVFEEVEMIEGPAWTRSGEGISLSDAESGVALMLKNGPFTCILYLNRE